MRSFACSKERANLKFWIDQSYSHYICSIVHWQPVVGRSPASQLLLLLTFAILVYLYLWKPVKSLSREDRLAKSPLAFSKELHNMFPIPSSYLNNFISGLTLLWSDWLNSTSMLTDGKRQVSYFGIPGIAVLCCWTEVTGSVGLFCW